MSLSPVDWKFGDVGKKEGSVGIKGTVGRAGRKDGEQ
jgi:hypothetical protein